MASLKNTQTKAKGSSSRKPRARSSPFLLEIGTEELPSAFLRKALDLFEYDARQMFESSRLAIHSLQTLGTPRRLALVVEGVGPEQDSFLEEVFGPPEAAAYDSAGKPTKAAEGFAKSQGVPVDHLMIKETHKGMYVYVNKDQPRQPAKRVLADAIPKLLAQLSFPKAMRWNESRVRFARPVRWIVAMLGKEVLSFEFAGIRSSVMTRGHRFYRAKGKKPGQTFSLTTAANYIETMKKLGVLVDPDERSVKIKAQIAKLAKSAKGQLDPVYREELIEEAICGVEYPHAILGTFQKEFLALPKSVLISSMKEHQGFLSLVGKDDRLLPKFVAVTNMPWGNTKVITKGNERVLSARLKDAQYFFQEDEKQPLHERVPALDGIIFHHKLGTMRQKVGRVRELAGWMAMTLDRLDLKNVCERAALLSKADLTTGMVGEFPNLQGVMGEEYARHDGEPQEVCQAIGEQYLPRFPDDHLPTSLPGMLVACADRCDSIASFFAVGMAPSGSEDPLGLRRAAYGLFRIVNETSLRLNMVDVFDHMLQILAKQGVGDSDPKTIADIIGFILDRLRFYGWKTMGLRGDVMEAVTRVRPKNKADLGDLLSRMQALQVIARLPDFETLMIGFKRAHRIVEKEQWRHTDVMPERFTHESEQRLFQVLDNAQQDVADFVNKREYGHALQTLLTFKTPIDEFFEAVLVNDSDPHIRENRLSQLTAIDRLFLTIADFSCIQSVGTEVG
jgi:glycyl-tRNA synthetase beta chain